MTVDFDLDDGIVFPQPVTQKMSSREYMAQIKSLEVPLGMVGLWFLGQNSWILKGPEGQIIAIDPYLTDFCASGRTKDKKPKSRLLPIFIEPEDLEADLVLITHSHTDHCDPFTIERLSIKNNARFAAPWQAAEVLKSYGIPESNLSLIHPLQKFTLDNVEVTGTFAEPTDFSDLNHIGFVLQFSNGKRFYNTGDTAKSELLAHAAAFAPDVMTVCINGGYHNLSHWEAAEITAMVRPKTVIPAHFDMMPHNLQSPHMFRKSLFEKYPQGNYKKMSYYEPFFF